MQLPLESNPARDRQATGDAPTRATSAATEPEGAATLTAAMVRRGHNPWWGKDQISATAAATPVDDDDVHGGAAAEPATPRKPFHRIDIDDGDGDDGDGNDGNGSSTRRFSFDWRDSGLWRDVALFLTVFFAASSAMLYLSLRAL